ncbi:MAG: divalent metal cation transporter, partial [Myxococcales bacterium]|nr:divalent metal cation transporter [Myxococcales bacterium]
GRWALVLYGLLTVGTMFTVQAAVTIVTAGLAVALFGKGVSVLVYAGLITILAGAIAGFGQFKVLDRVVKVIVVTLTIATLVATALALPKIDWGAAQWALPREGWDPKTIIFCAALVGWMPTAFDISVWHSLWTLARRDETGHTPSVREVLFDFNVGYIGTAILALCYVTLGAAVMHGSGATLAESAGAFAQQVIDLYTENLGAWSRPVIAVCAFGVMCSTVLTVIDGFPRALAGLYGRFRGPERADARQHDRVSREYWVFLVILGAGSMLVLAQFLGSLKGLVDLATILSFLTAPMLAWLNHRAIHSDEVPTQHRPSRGMTIFSWVSIVSLSAFAAYFLALRFG